MLLWPQISLKLLQTIHEFPFLLHPNTENQRGCQKPLSGKSVTAGDVRSCRRGWNTGSVNISVLGDAVKRESLVAGTLGLF